MSAIGTITAIEAHNELKLLRRHLPGLDSMTTGRERATDVCGVELHTTSLGKNRMALQNSQHELSIILKVESDGTIITVDSIVFGDLPKA